jgi:hypothetical protein
MEPTRTQYFISCLATGVLLIASGCTDSVEPSVPPQPSTPQPPDGCDAVDLDPPAPGEGVQVEIEMPLDPGEERQACRLVLLERAVNLNWSEGLYTRGSHHGLTARTRYRDQLPTENIRGEHVEDASQLATCESLSSDWDILGVIAGGHGVGVPARTQLHGKGSLPDDVAMRIEAGEILALNFHMINLSERPIHACYKQNLYSIPDKRVKHEAGTMFYYNSFVTVPARQSVRATMACPVQHDVFLGDQVSHMHKRGLEYHASLLDGDPLAGGKEIEELYDTNEWEEPLARVNSPALQLHAGQWIRWSCEFANPEDRDVAQGQETTDEMCMFLGTYWPRSPEMDWCMTPNSSSAYTASRLLAEGTSDGAEFLKCWNQSPQIVGGGGPRSAEARYATQRCFTQSCAAVSGRVQEFGAGKLDPTQLTCD